jgi:hypothetical protein
MIFLHLKRGNPIHSDTNLDSSKLNFTANYSVGIIPVEKVLDGKTGEELKPDSEVAVNQTVTLVPPLKHGTDGFALKRGKADLIPSPEMHNLFAFSLPTRLRAGQDLVFSCKAKKKMLVSDLIGKHMLDLYMYIGE